MILRTGLDTERRYGAKTKHYSEKYELDKSNAKNI